MNIDMPLNKETKTKTNHPVRNRMIAKQDKNLLTGSCTWLNRRKFEEKTLEPVKNQLWNHQPKNSSVFSPSSLGSYDRLNSLKHELKGWTNIFHWVNSTFGLSLFLVNKKSSSTSCRATSTDIPDPLSLLLPIIHRFWQVFRATSRILT